MPEDENKCSGLIGKIFGHNFQPVIEHEGKPTAKHIRGQYSAEEMAQMTEASKSYKETYKGSVCSRCGKTVKAPGIV